MDDARGRGVDEGFCGGEGGGGGKQGAGALDVYLFEEGRA